MTKETRDRLKHKQAFVLCLTFIIYPDSGICLTRGLYTFILVLIFVNNNRL